MMDDPYIQELERKITDLKERWPVHSVPPALMLELDALEEALAKALEQARLKENHA